VLLHQLAGNTPVHRHDLLMAEPLEVPFLVSHLKCWRASAVPVPDPWADPRSSLLKAQGATYGGESFTLAGDDTIHLEAVHVALSRGTKANHLYYTGEPPPHEDHHHAEVAEPALEGLVAAAGRSRAQIMALDLLHATPSADAIADAPARRRRESEAWAASSQAAPPIGPTTTLDAVLSRAGRSMNAGR
jgi:hypothetical protein